MSVCDKGVYYWHKETKKTQWHFPEEEATGQEKEKLKSHFSVPEQGTVSQQASAQMDTRSAIIREQSQNDNTYDEIGKPAIVPADTKASVGKKPPPVASAKQDLSTFPPPVPQRRFDEEPERAPPIPVRMYSPPPLSLEEGAPLKRCNSDAVGGRVARQIAAPKDPSHYATVVLRELETDPDAPPLPERTAESEELIPTGLPEQHALPEDTIAYAIVCCNGDQAEKPAKKALPAEKPAPSAPPLAPNNPSTEDSSANKKWRTVYEEIDLPDMGGGKKTTPLSAGPGTGAPGKTGPAEDGKYMVVDSNKATTLRIVQQPASFPLASWKPATSPMTTQPPAPPASVGKKAAGTLPSLGIGPSTAALKGKEGTQSLGDLQAEYDLPLNSRRLISQPSPVSSDDPSYSKLVTESDQMVALRSGVQLRRSSISGSEMLLTPRPDDGEEQASGEDIIDKCIRSLQEGSVSAGSASVVTTPTSSAQEGSVSVSRPLADTDRAMVSAGYKLQKIPDTPPRWLHAKRKPHVYEDVDRGRGAGPGDRTSLCTVSSRSLPDLEFPELDWDESDLGPSSTHAQGTVGSASQPNLLDPQLFDSSSKNAPSSSAKGVGVGDSVGANPPQRRRKNHCYEDIDMDVPENMMDRGSDLPGNMMDRDLDPPGSAVDTTVALKRKIHASLHETRSTVQEERLPRGWQTMFDENGVKYYWHVPSGKTQYEKPTGEQLRRNSASQLQSDSGTATPKCQSFTARYINFLPVQESDLVPGECVKVVHACISKLMSNRDSSAAIEKGKVVTLQIEDMIMKWLSPESSTPLCVQPIGKIRVWGIGLENDRDFGYVARDRVSQQHRCHVFRCDNPARALGRALLGGHQLEKKGGLFGMDGSPTKEPAVREGRVEKVISGPIRESSQLSSENAQRPSLDGGDGCQTFLCMYMGSCEVTKPSGMDLLNEAVEQLQTNTAHWVNVQLEVSDSNVKIVDIKTKRLLKEHRIRFLSFLGIATNSRYCGYIVDLGGKDKGKKFQFHGFKKEPNTDQMCLALHNACQKRYQRVIEASAEVTPQLKPLENVKEQEQSETGSKLSVFSRRGSSRKSVKVSEPQDVKHTFPVYYFGSMVTHKAEGVEAVTEPLQKLYTSKTNYSTPFLVDFEISTQGLTIIDSQKRIFSKKIFDVKSITYVARIRTYFAIVMRENGKYHCHVFLEAEVDSGTIVSTIQKSLGGEGSPQKKS